MTDTFEVKTKLSQKEVVIPNRETVFANTLAKTKGVAATIVFTKREIQTFAKLLSKKVLKDCLGGLVLCENFRKDIRSEIGYLGGTRT